MTLQSINPATGAVLRTWPAMDAAACAAVVDAAGRAQAAWRRTGIDDRAAVVRRVAALLARDREALARGMTLEMGKPIAQSRAEIDKCAWACAYFADHGPGFLAPEAVPTDGRRSYVAFRPLGVVLGIMPWNFPYWQVLRFAAPALVAGNAVVLKHAPNVTGCAEAIAALWHEAGLPEGLFGVLRIAPADVDAAVAALVAHPAVQAVTLTGSTRAGRAVAARAGAHVKKTVLELGGSDPSVVLADADVDAAARACAASRLINGGQSCIAAKRFVVVDAVRAAFTERLVAHLAAACVGDPLADDTDVGPLARLDLRDTLHGQVAASVAAGARPLLGGAVPAGPGAYYPVTVLADVAPGMPAYAEETFGPVAAVIAARDTADALRIANDTAYGLGAAVYTADVAAGERIAADDLDAGSCFVNAFVKSDPRLPFGGIKHSGYGREMGAFGIREFVNVKTVYVA
ncbi:succinate-semialdehyde dehydrogenase [bacterium]|nr:MAG: succinate-semialdehyde dehydrogenase [bacterium]